MISVTLHYVVIQRAIVVQLQSFVSFVTMDKYLFFSDWRNVYFDIIINWEIKFSSFVDFESFKDFVAYFI